jgi:hypothetical protein
VVPKIFQNCSANFDSKTYAAHFKFWQGKDVPDSEKFRATVLYWTAKEDGFRYDMAEMVPYEFWELYELKLKKNPDVFNGRSIQLKNTATTSD